MRTTVMTCDNCGTDKSNSWISSVYFSWDYCSESCHEEAIRERKKKQNQKELDKEKERTEKLKKTLALFEEDDGIYKVPITHNDKVDLENDLGRLWRSYD